MSICATWETDPDRSKMSQPRVEFQEDPAKRRTIVYIYATTDQDRGMAIAVPWKGDWNWTSPAILVENSKIEV